MPKVLPENTYELTNTIVLEGLLTDKITGAEVSTTVNCVVQKIAPTVTAADSAAATETGAGTGKYRRSFDPPTTGRYKWFMETPSGIRVHATRYFTVV